VAEKIKSTQEKADEAKSMPLEKMFEKYETSKDGLRSEEAKNRVSKYGYNELMEEKRSVILAFLSYFWGPIPWMIEIAAILSAVVRHWPDFFIILALLIMNAIVGFWEENQANNTIDALKKKLALKARVKRDGKWTTVPAREIVPGDIVRLRIGEIIPADAKLMDGDPIEVDQSALTGESLPVDRGKGDIVYSGSVTRQGEIEAVVYATGENTYFGKTAELVSEAHTVSHFQRAVLKIGDYLIMIALVLAILIILIALFRGDNIITTLQFVLVLTVAAVPVAMPTVLTVTMAVGARFLARKEAIVTKLAAIEELAGVDVLCSDKTGTLTQNKMTLGEPHLIGDHDKHGVIIDAALASREEDQDPIDLVVLSGVKDKKELEKYEIVHFQPFDPVNKRSEATVKDPDGKQFKVSKGAPQVILDLADNKDKVKDEVDKAVNDNASRGFRSLGVAKTDENGKWKYIGVLSLFDPPREDSKETLKTAKLMGVKTKMITGDQVAIAKEIARQLGLGTNILNADVFKKYGAGDLNRLGDDIENADGFAQVFPEHKFQIIEALQKRKHIVGMTGDGVNDAPPLKKADAGIAVSGATDAARSAADIVLLQPGLSVIIDAFKEARKAFQRMTNYSIYRITETIRVLLFMTLSIMIFNFYPVTAVMIVLLAILNDGAILSIAYDRVRISSQPEKWNMRIVLGLATVLGITGVIASFTLFFLAYHVYHLDKEVVQSLIYLKLSVAGHMTVFVARTRGPFWSVKPSKALFLAVLGTQTLATLIVVYGIFMHPIGWGLAALVWVYAFIWFLLMDLVKLETHRFLDPNRSTLVAARRLVRKKKKQPERQAA
jgi:H+-transporting ATPase